MPSPSPLDCSPSPSPRAASSESSADVCRVGPRTSWRVGFASSRCSDFDGALRRPGRRPSGRGASVVVGSSRRRLGVRPAALAAAAATAATAPARRRLVVGVAGALAGLVRPSASSPRAGRRRRPVLPRPRRAPAGRRGRRVGGLEQRGRLRGAVAPRPARPPRRPAWSDRRLAAGGCGSRPSSYAAAGRRLGRREQRRRTGVGVGRRPLGAAARRRRRLGGGRLRCSGGCGVAGARPAPRRERRWPRRLRSAAAAARSCRPRGRPSWRSCGCAVRGGRRRSSSAGAGCRGGAGRRRRGWACGRRAAGGRRPAGGAPAARRGAAAVPRLSLGVAVVGAGVVVCSGPGRACALLRPRALRAARGPVVVRERRRRSRTQACRALGGDGLPLPSGDVPRRASMGRPAGSTAVDAYPGGVDVSRSGTNGSPTVPACGSRGPWASRRTSGAAEVPSPAISRRPARTSSGRTAGSACRTTTSSIAQSPRIRTPVAASRASAARLTTRRARRTCAGRAWSSG